MELWYLVAFFQHHQISIGVIHLFSPISWHRIGLVGRVLANSPRDLGSIPSCVIPKTLKMVLDISLFNTQHYKLCIKGKVEQSRKRSSALPIPQGSSYRKWSLLVALDYLPTLPSELHFQLH